MERRKRVVLVGVKRGGASGRELLTWALAKFTKPGDRLIVLHIAPAATASDRSQPTPRQDDDNVVKSDGSRGDENVFESVTGLYDGFCTTRNIDLQFRIREGRSTRKVLAKEAESCAATRLILGASGAQPPTSFPVARYCSKNLPFTCSVLVIYHGKVVYEKPGYRRNGLDDDAIRRSGASKWNIEIPQSLKRASGRQMVTSGELIKACRPREHASSARRRKCISMDILDPYTYIAPHLQISKSKRNVVRSLPSLCANSLQVVCLAHRKKSKDKKKRLHDEPCRSIENVSLLEQPSSLCVMKHRIQKSHPVSNENCNMKSEVIGWPLLHNSIAMLTCSRISKSHHPVPKHKMSVIEWVLRLPERPKSLLLPPSVTHVSVSPLREAEDVQSCSLACTTGNPQAKDCRFVSKPMSCREFGFIDLQRATDNFSTSKMIGNGGCSHVYRGTLSDGLMVAIKSFLSSSDAEKAFFTELEISRCLEHPHVIQLLGYCIHNKHHLLVYNFAAEGNLEQKLHGDQRTVLPWHIRYHAAVGVAKALAYLHNLPRPVIHRDIKSSNIVLLSDLTPQLIDFGLSIWAPTTSSHITCNDVLGTFGYLAPEYFMYGKVNEKTDVYAFGVVLLELISGRHPLRDGMIQVNLVTWAKPFLNDESRFAQLVDQKLNGEYNAHQLQIMVFAAALCLRQSNLARPPIAKILQLLKEGSINLEESKSSDEGDSLPVINDRDLRSHITVALCGLDDDTSNDGSTDYTNSNMFIEEYLQQRHSRP